MLMFTKEGIFANKKLNILENGVRCDHENCKKTYKNYIKNNYIFGVLIKLRKILKNIDTCKQMLKATI